jgi:hypothetical protein
MVDSSIALRVPPRIMRSSLPLFWNQAMKRLEDLAFFGLFERMDDSLRLLAHTLCWNFDLLPTTMRQRKSPHRGLLHKNNNRRRSGGAPAAPSSAVLAPKQRAAIASNCTDGSSSASSASSAGSGSSVSSSSSATSATSAISPSSGSSSASGACSHINNDDSADGFSAARRIVEDRNAADRRLYAFASSLFDRRLAQMRADRAAGLLCRFHGTECSVGVVPQANAVVPEPAEQPPVA